MRLPITPLIAGALLFLVGSGQARAQTRTVVHGRVLGPSSDGIENAVIRVIQLPDSTERVARTNTAGAYSVTFDRVGVTYVVSVSMLGYGPQRRTIAPQGTDSIAAVDFHLLQVAARLGTVRATAERPKPARSETSEFGAPGSSISFADMTSGRSGDVTGDLTAALMTLPGITVTPSATGGLPTVSAFGQTSDQNNVVLNGLGFGGTPPRDGFGLSVISSSYDPSRGGFAGVQLALRMNSGSDLVTRTVHATLDAPALQVTTPVAERLGTRYDQQVVSGVASGPMVRDRAYYAFSYQFNHRASPLSSLFNATPASLIALHVSPDSVDHLFSTLGALGIPAVLGGTPGDRATNEGRFAFRLDLSPPTTNANAQSPGSIAFRPQTTTDNYNIQIGGDWRGNDGSFISPTSLPAAGGNQGHRDGWLQLVASKYLPGGFLNEASMNVTGRRDTFDPYLVLPTASVLVASQFSDTSVGISALQIGGASAVRSTSSAWSTELRDQFSRYTWDRRHLFALTLDGTVDHFSINQAVPSGSYVYNSLADLAASSPTSFSRQLTGRLSDGGEAKWAAGFGDTYAPSQNFRTQYGVRIEGNHFNDRPAFNPQVDSIFGLRTDHVPNTLAIMPMAGFTWRTLGSIGFPGTAQRFPRGSISGGIREYRGTLTANTIDNYARQTGLADAIQQIYCVGAATPVPQWRNYVSSSSSIPTQCADGSAGSSLAQVTPPVALFAPDYELSRSWRPTVNVNYAVTPSIDATVGGTYALNLNQSGIYDVNFAPSPSFALGSEGGRPVYVPVSSIVPSTGALTWTASRRSLAFAHVAESRSDLRSDVRMLTANVSLRPAFTVSTRGFWNLNLNYAYNSPREQVYGFGGTTADDPSLKSWTPGGGAHHVVTASFTQSMPSLVSYSFTARMQSGTPYTPTVAGDINGDGYSNDRAFVFSPNTAPDTGTASAMSRLLSGTSSSARQCLLQQMGHVAGRNSCTGPWSFPLFNASITPDPYRLGLGNRGSFSILFANVLGGLDQLVHGANRLHGWGQYAYADPTLLTVRGYDQTQNRFIYSVNPQFGNTSVFRTTYRSPFVITFDFRLETGPDRETQYMNSALRLKQGESRDELTIEQIKSKIVSRPFNPFDGILQQKDSLHLTPTQVDSLTTMSRRYAVTRDSMITDLARFLAARHGNYAGEEVRQRWHATAVAAFTEARNRAAASKAIFTPAQMEKLKENLTLATFIVQDYTPEQIAQLLRFPIAQLP